MPDFTTSLDAHGLSLRRKHPAVLQINVGKLCNQSCAHCHVDAGPRRREIMTRKTIARIVDWLADSKIPTVDITGGAPEMIPVFRYLVDRFRQLRPRRNLIDRCDLTIFVATGHDGPTEFLADAAL